MEANPSNGTPLVLELAGSRQYNPALHPGTLVQKKYTPRPEHPQQQAPECKIHALNFANPEKLKAKITPFDFMHLLFSNFPNVTYVEMCTEDPPLNSRNEMCAHAIRQQPLHAFKRNHDAR